MDELVRSFRAQLLGDDRLARLVTAGSDTAFSTLYKRYQRPLYRYCRSILRSDADAHDAVQSTLARAFEALRRGQRDAPVRPWIYRIAYNESISLIRARRAEDELSGFIAPYVAGPEELVHGREQLGSLLEDLGRLPQRPREAILLRELSGMSHEEIAASLGTSLNGAKQAIFEARTALTEFAAGRNMACADVREAISLGDRRVLRGRRVSAHLRDCAACAQFAADLNGRGGRPPALWPPFPAGAVTALLSRLGRAGSSVGAGASPAGASLIGGLANSFGAMIFTVKGALVAAALVAGAGAAEVQVVAAKRPPVSTAVRPPSFISTPATSSSQATAQTASDNGAARTSGTAGGLHGRVVAAGWAPRNSASAHAVRGPWVSTASSPVRVVGAPAAASASRGEPPRGSGASRGGGRGQDASAEHGAGVSAPGRGANGSSRAANSGRAADSARRAPRDSSAGTPRGNGNSRGNGNPTPHGGHGDGPHNRGHGGSAPPSSGRGDGSPANSSGNGGSGGSPDHGPPLVPPAVSAPLEGVAKNLPQTPPGAGRP